MVASTIRDSVPTAPSAAARPVLAYRGRSHDHPPVLLDRAVTVIGSKPGCHVHLASREVSGCHALILSVGDRFYLRDLNSRTHVHYNGSTVREAYLRHGDQIRIGPYEFDVLLPTSAAASRRRLRRRSTPLSLQVEGSSVPPTGLHGPVFLIGRRRGADLRIANNRVSNAHAAIVDIDGHCDLMDLGSRDGTILNGRKVAQSTVNPGDLVSIGGVSIRITGDPAAAAETWGQRELASPTATAPPPAAEPKAAGSGGPLPTAADAEMPGEDGRQSGASSEAGSELHSPPDVGPISGISYGWPPAIPDQALECSAEAGVEGAELGGPSPARESHATHSAARSILGLTAVAGAGEATRQAQSSSPVNTVVHPLDAVPAGSAARGMEREGDQQSDSQTVPLGSEPVARKSIAKAGASTPPGPVEPAPTSSARAAQTDGIDATMAAERLVAARTYANQAMEQANAAPPVEAAAVSPSGTIRPAPATQGSLRFKEWGPIAAAVANPEFLEMWGASRRQLLPGSYRQRAAGTSLASTLLEPDVENHPRRARRKWMWVAVAVLVLMAAAGLTYTAGWWQRWVAL